MKTEHWESKLIWEYFRNIRHGFFVEVGANGPKHESMTYFLEEQGWTGILVEPNPGLCPLLRQHRPNSRVFETAACAPGEVGHADLHLSPGGGHSSIRPKPEVMSLKAGTVRVSMRTLDSILEEAAPKYIDFISLDVEGMEIDVLRGFNLQRWRPRLVLLEDFLENLATHKFVTQLGYKFIRRTGYNNWYIPAHINESCFSESTSRELLRLGRKILVNPPSAYFRRKLKAHGS